MVRKHISVSRRLLKYFFAKRELSDLERLMKFEIGETDKDTDKKIKRANPGSAHITLSLKDGFKPGDANSMFKKPKIKKNVIGYVEGKINYIKLN